MRKALTYLAIAALVVTIIAAGAVLYGIRTMTPQAVSITATVTPAAQEAETLDALRAQIADGLFAGRVFQEGTLLDAQDCAFVTYTVRLKNSGFFPAEWISLEVAPLTDGEQGDWIQLENAGANVLYAGAQGDLHVTILTTLDPAQRERTIEMTCYTFGRKQTLRMQAE